MVDLVLKKKKQRRVILENLYQMALGKVKYRVHLHFLSDMMEASDLADALCYLTEEKLIRSFPNAWAELTHNGIIYIEANINKTGYDITK